MSRKQKHISSEDRKEAAIEAFKREREIAESLKRSNLKGASFKRKVEALYESGNLGAEVLNTIHHQIVHFFNYFVSKKNAHKRRVFRDLLLHLDKKKCNKILGDTELIVGLFNITKNCSWFIREIESWDKKSHNPIKQFSSLLRHLFCEYPVPLFLDSAWLIQESDYQKNWLIQIGIGKSIRKLNNVPIIFTKRIAHQFGKAPSDLTVAEALRWAQVRGKGGNELLASHIYQSRLGREEFRDELFWNSFIDFIIDADMFDYEKIDEICDFLYFTRNEDQTYSLKGRNIATVLRASNEWHYEENMTRNRGGKLIWAKSGIGEFSYEEGEKDKVKIFEVLELISSNELIAEGRKMNHCVASYASSCNRGRCSIFSIRKKDLVGNLETLATIEVSLQTKRIVQARARFNKEISPKARMILQRWSNKEGLIIPKWLLKN